MQIETLQYPQLYKKNKFLQNARLTILKRWLQSPTIGEIFKHHRISLDKFSTLFAPKIIEYLLGVIRGENISGECPVMSKFVRYMLTRDIAPDEVYSICTRLRKEFTLCIFEAQKMSTNEAVLFLKELALLFDASFSAILRYFHDTSKKRYIEHFNLVSQTVEMLGVHLFLVQSGAVILANRDILKTLGVASLEDLHMKFGRGLSFVNRVNFKNDLFESFEYTQWSEAAVATKETIEILLFDTLSRTEKAYTLWVKIFDKSEPKKYLYTLQQISSLGDTLPEDYTSNRDKLTSIYSYAYFKEHIGKIDDLFKSDKYALVVVDIENLREINEKQGYEKGDRLIIRITEKIKSLSEESSLLFRMSGRKIGIFIKSDSKQKVYDWSVHLRCELELISQELLLSLISYQNYQSATEAELHALKLLVSHQKINNRHVLTNIEEIDAYDLLDNQEMIIERLKKLNEVIEGVLLFEEIMVKSKSKIIKSTQKTLFLSVSTKQLSVANVGSHYYLNSKTLGHIRSTIKSIDRESASIELLGFAFDEHTPLKRKLVRVTSDAALEIELIDDKKSIEGELLYLNEKYISIRLKRKKTLKIGKLVTLDITIDTKYLELEGSVYMLKKEKDEYVCVIEIYHTHSSNTLFRRYIAKRQLSIIKELNARLI